MYLCVVFVVHQHVPDTPCTPIAHPMNTFIGHLIIAYFVKYFGHFMDFV